MNKIIYLIVGVVIIGGVIFALRGDGGDISKVINNNSEEETRVLDSQESSINTNDTDYNSSESDPTTANVIDEDIDSYGDKIIILNTVDNDCDNPHGESSACLEDDSVRGVGTTEEQSGEVAKLDSDDDGDSVPTKELDSTEMQSSGFIKIDDVKGE